MSVDILPQTQLGEFTRQTLLLRLHVRP